MEVRFNYRFHERNKMKIVMAFDLDDHEPINTKVRTEFPFTVFPLLKKSSNKKAFKQLLTVPEVSRLKKWLEGASKTKLRLVPSCHGRRTAKHPT